MLTSGSTERLSNPPHTLVVGTGSWANSLAQVLDGTVVKPKALVTKSRLPTRTFNSAQRVFVVVESSWIPADAVEMSDRIYRLLLDTGPKGGLGKFHRLATVFICPDHFSSQFEIGLAEGFGLTAIKPAKGVTLWRNLESLHSLLLRIADAGTADWSELENRRASQPRHRAVSQLRTAILSGPKTKIFTAAKEVRKAFGTDIFVAFENYCTPPRHPHANQWRSWLCAVSRAVTPKSWVDAKRLLPTLKTSIP